ncbi:hypothetical protein CHS0354_019453 [Potamilus streckersoni]|uniref:Superoxide dismutase copper/zinc binding domain-containing protein n=1 Tax=Potamilus streckersoni TaxID=2493646 RepID=A0AAE0SHK0_9BIVA|nr:hypothetical protein CHS0354_019453 [Potamilus streckersoni]
MNLVFVLTITLGSCFYVVKAQIPGTTSFTTGFNNPNTFSNTGFNNPNTFSNTGFNNPNTFSNTGFNNPNTFSSTGNTGFNNGVGTNAFNQGGFLTDPTRQGGFMDPLMPIGGFQSFQPLTDGSPVGIGAGGFGQVFGLGPMPATPGAPFPPGVSPMANMFMTMATNPNNYRYATCVFNDTWSPVRGRVEFRQFILGESQVNIRVQVSGLPPSVVEVERAIHIHDYGDTGDGCARVGPHFNPTQTRHGSQRNFAFLRHVGDLGNMRQSAQGISSTQFSDQVISLNGPNNIIGRSFVIKFERDDEGQGTNSGSQINGNARTPIACCTVASSSPNNWNNFMSASDMQNMGQFGQSGNNFAFNGANGNFMNNGFSTFNTGMTGMNTGFNTGFNNGFNTANAGTGTGFNSVNTGLSTFNTGTNLGMNTFGTGMNSMPNAGTSAFISSGNTFSPTGNSGQAFNVGGRRKK